MQINPTLRAIVEIIIRGDKAVQPKAVLQQSSAIPVAPPVDPVLLAAAQANIVQAPVGGTSFERELKLVTQNLGAVKAFLPQQPLKDTETEIKRAKALALNKMVEEDEANLQAAQNVQQADQQPGMVEQQVDAAPIVALLDKGSDATLEALHRQLPNIFDKEGGIKTKEGKAARDTLVAQLKELAQTQHFDVFQAIACDPLFVALDQYALRARQKSGEHDESQLVKNMSDQTKNALKEKIRTYMQLAILNVPLEGNADENDKPRKQALARLMVMYKDIFGEDKFYETIKKDLISELKDIEKKNLGFFSASIDSWYSAEKTGVRSMDDTIRNSMKEKTETSFFDKEVFRKRLAEFGTTRPGEAQVGEEMINRLIGYIDPFYNSQKPGAAREAVQAHFHEISSVNKPYQERLEAFAKLQILIAHGEYDSSHIPAYNEMMQSVRELEKLLVQVEKDVAFGQGVGAPGKAVLLRGQSSELSAHLPETREASISVQSQSGLSKKQQ